MKIRLLRGSHVVKEIEFPAGLPPLEIHRLSVDLMFEHFERNATPSGRSRKTRAGHATKFKSSLTRETF